MAYQGSSFHDDFALVSMRKTQKLHDPQRKLRGPAVDMESNGKPGTSLPLLIMLNGYCGIGLT